MKILIVASLTLKEALRKRIILAGVVLTLLFLALYATGVHFIMGEVRHSVQNGDMQGGLGAAGAVIQFQANLMFFMGLFMANMIGALVAVFAACGTLSGEIEQGTLQAIAARPITRAQIVAGKWLGLGAMLAVYLGALFLLLVFIIYSQSGWMPPNTALACLIFIGGALVVLSVTLFGSAFLSTTVNAIIVLMLYMTALVGGMMEQIGVMIGKQSLFTTGIISGFIMPTDALYRYTVNLLRPSPGRLDVYLPRGAELGPFGAASPPSAWMLAYAFLFAVVLLSAAMSVFSKRDL